MAKKNIEAEVRRLDERTKNAEALQKFLIGVQLGSLVKAERLRKLAVTATNGKPQSLRELGAFVAELEPFTTMTKQIEKKALKYLKRR